MKEARLSRQMLRLVVCPHPASGGEAVHQSTSQWTSSADSELLLRKDFKMQTYQSAMNIKNSCQLCISKSFHNWLHFFNVIELPSVFVNIVIKLIERNRNTLNFLWTVKVMQKKFMPWLILYWAWHPYLLDSWSWLCEGLAWTLAELSVNIGCEWNYCDLLFAEQHSVTITSSKWRSSLCEGFATREARSDRSCREDLKHLLVCAHTTVDKSINQAKIWRFENAEQNLCSLQSKSLNFEDPKKIVISHSESLYQPKISP